MVCLESAFAQLRQVYFFSEETTLSVRKPESLNFSLAGPGGTWPHSAELRLSLDNPKDHPHTGDR